MTGNQSVRQFFFRTDADVRLFMEFMRENRRPMAEQGRFLQVTVAEYKPSRSIEQNRFMWVALLKPMSEQVVLNGVRYTDEAWNLQAKKLFLPEVNAKGMSKWRPLPDGTRELVMSTSNLNEDEMSLYLKQLEAYAVSELNVRIPADPRQF